MTLPVLSPVFRCLQKTLQESHCLTNGAVGPVALIPGQEHPGQGDVLELAQVAEVVLGGQALLPRPAEGFAQSPLRDPQPCLQRRDRPHIGEEVTHIQALGLLQQIERAVQIALGLPYARHRHAPAIPVLREPGVLAQLLASQQVLRGGLQIVILAVELAHAHVHVCRSPQRGVRPAPSQAAILAHRSALPRGDDLARSVYPPGRRAPDCVRDVPGHLQMSHALGIRLVRCLQIPTRPGGEPQERRRRSAPEMVVLGDEVEHPPGVFHGVGHVAQQPGPVPARATAIAAGRRRNSSSSTTTIVSNAEWANSEFGMATGSSLFRIPNSAFRIPEGPATVRRPAVVPQRPLARRCVSNASAYATLSTGRYRITSSGSALSQPSNVASCLLRRMAGTARSIRSAARAKSSAASAWRIASATDPCCSYHSLARRCSVDT